MAATKYIEDIKVIGMEKIKKDIAGKRYEFVLKVKWSNDVEATIYRPHSMFFDFQGVLVEMFRDAKIPSAPVAKFHWMLLSKLGGQEKECRSMEEFCQKIIRLPPSVSQASIVLHFFETWGTDLRSNQKSSELFDPSVGRASITSSQEHPPNKSSHNERHEEFRIVANYNAANIGELSLTEGTTVTVVEKNETGWWFVALDNGKQGWAPATYLEPVSSEKSDCDYDWVSVVDFNGRGEQYISIISYNAQNSDELSYTANTQVEVLEKSSYGWWKVRIKDKEGITPATNLRRVEESFYYQTSSELKSRTVSISSASGLYAVIRKPPPRKESVRSRSSSGISTLQSPPGSLKKNNKFFYSQASFSGGRFILGEEKENEKPPEVQPRKSSLAEHSVLRENYENVQNEMQTLPEDMKTGVTTNGNNEINLSNNYKNYKAAKPGETNETEYYQALADYVPPDHKREDLSIQAGDIVQYISSEGGWMFALKLHGGQQGWVPETYLERKHNFNGGSSVNGTLPAEKPKPIPRPRPAPRPRINSPRSASPPIPSFTPPPPPKQDDQPPSFTPPPPPKHGEKQPSPAARNRNTSLPLLSFQRQDSGSLPGSPVVDHPRDSSTLQHNTHASNVQKQEYRRSSSPNTFNTQHNAPPNATNSKIMARKDSPGSPMNRFNGNRPPLPAPDDSRPPLPAPLLGQIQNIGKYEEDVYDQPEEVPLRSVYDSEPWYYGKITRNDCERILGTYGRNKEFLVRESRRAPGSYALSVKYCYRIRHFPIELTPDSMLAIGKLTFPNLMDIVAYYQDNPLFYSEHKEPISLGKCLLKENVLT